MVFVAGVRVVEFGTNWFQTAAIKPLFPESIYLSLGTLG